MLFYVVDIQRVANQYDMATNDYKGKILKAFHKRNVPTKRYFRYEITPVLTYLHSI